MPGQCYDVPTDCTRTSGGRYECSDVKWTQSRIVDGAGTTISQADFLTQSYGVNGIETVEYCVVAWGVHSAGAPADERNVGPVDFEAGDSASFEHRAIRITSDLYDQFAVIDPVEAGEDASAVHIVWDRSAESVRTAPIPHDYYGVDSSGTCSSGSPSVTAGATHQELVVYVQTVELPPTGLFETGEYNVALAFQLPYYYERGYRDLALTSTLRCYALDGTVHSWSAVTAVSHTRVCESC